MDIVDETDHRHDEDEDDDEMTDVSIRQTYFQCPPCGAKFSNASGAWQHFFVRHDTGIKMKEVKTWRKKRVAIESDDDNDSLLNDPPSNHSTKTEGLAFPAPVIHKTDATSVNPDVIHPRLLRARKPNMTANAKEPELHLEAGKKKCSDCCEIVNIHLEHRHAVVHVDASLPCPYCIGVFAKRYQLVRHMEKAHYQGFLEWRVENGKTVKTHEQVQCSDCSEILVDEYRYRMHQAMHRAGTLSCPKGCKGKFSANRRLSAHLRSAHQNNDN